MATRGLIDAAAGLRRSGQDFLSDPALPRDRAQLWANPILGGVEVTCCRFIHHCFARHTHDRLMIGLIEAGAKSFARTRTQHLVGAGEISIVNAGEMHTGSRASEEELRYRGLYVPQALFERSFAVAQAAICDRALFVALWRASVALISDSSRLEQEERLLASIGMLARRYGDRAPIEEPAPRALLRARELLNECREADLSIDVIAAAVDLNPYHLMRSFSRRFGIPMHAYRIGVRVERAKSMLRASDEPIARVALECGFADQSHLTRHFKKIAGVTPADYRRAYKACDCSPYVSASFQNPPRRKPARAVE
jgi:AraC-like DNA-binding protein